MQRACQEEIDELFNDPVKCVNGDLTMDALSDLKYLERCCLETLRLFPVIFLFQRKVEVPVKLGNFTLMSLEYRFFEIQKELIIDI